MALFSSIDKFNLCFFSLLSLLASGRFFPNLSKGVPSRESQKKDGRRSVMKEKEKKEQQIDRCQRDVQLGGVPLPKKSFVFFYLCLIPPLTLFLHLFNLCVLLFCSQCSPTRSSWSETNEQHSSASPVRQFVRNFWPGGTNHFERKTFFTLSFRLDFMRAPSSVPYILTLDWSKVEQKINSPEEFHIIFAHNTSELEHVYYSFTLTNALKFMKLFSYKCYGILYEKRKKSFYSSLKIG